MQSTNLYRACLYRVVELDWIGLHRCARGRTRTREEVCMQMHTIASNPRQPHGIRRSGRGQSVIVGSCIDLYTHVKDVVALCKIAWDCA